MLEKLKAKMFPCTARINQAIEDNCRATDRLIRACQPKRVPATFPPFKEGVNVNPR